MKKTINIAVVTDEDGDQCMYVNGRCWESVGETTVYACDIEQEARGRYIKLSTYGCEHYDQWPLKLEDIEWRYAK